MGAAETTSCLAVEDISVKLGGKTVLHQVSLQVEDGEIVSVIGPNGAGKTTLFDVITGRLRPTGGRVFYRGRSIAGWPPHRVCRAGIGRTFQIARPFPEMTALENVLIGLWFGKGVSVGGRRACEQARELLEAVGLGTKVDTPARELTLSEQRRLEVARALSTRPKLLLLDEIAAGLSPQAVRQAMELVRALRTRGVTLLIIDHFLNLTARVSDRLVALDKGEKIAEGKPQEVIQNPEVISAYLGERRRRGEEGNGEDNEGSLVP